MRQFRVTGVEENRRSKEEGRWVQFKKGTKTSNNLSVVLLYTQIHIGNTTNVGECQNYCNPSK